MNARDPLSASQRTIRRVVVIWFLVCATNLTAACAQENKPEGRDDLDVTAPKTTLRVGEAVQLKVLHKLPDGSMRDLTGASTGTRYFTTAESRLISEADGRVTCIGTDGKPRESAIIGVENGKLHGSIRFRLVPGGPGPGLEVVADKLVLREGERAQLRVYRPAPGAAPQEVTSTSTGTRYLTFPGFGRHDPSVVSVNDDGTASATTSIGQYNRRTVIIFVRHGDVVGWLEVTVVPKGGAP